MTNGQQRATIATLSRDVTVLQTELAQVRVEVGSLTEKFDALQEKLFKRPSWTVATIITILTAISTALLGGVIAYGLH